MRMTKKRLIFFILHFIFSSIIPFTLVIVRYSNIGNTKEAVGFKLSFTGILLLILVFWIVKKLFLDKKISDLTAQKNNILADLKTEINPEKVLEQEKALKSINTLETIASYIIPFLFLMTCFLAFKGLEAQIVTLSSTLGFIIISIAVGMLFNILYVRQIQKK